MHPDYLWILIGQYDDRIRNCSEVVWRDDVYNVELSEVKVKFY